MINGMSQIWSLVLVETDSLSFFKLLEKTFENQTEFEEMANVKIEQKREGGTRWWYIVGLPGAKEDPVWEPTVTLPLLCLLCSKNTLSNTNADTNTNTNTKKYAEANTRNPVQSGVVLIGCPVKICKVIPR